MQWGFKGVENMMVREQTVFI